MVWIIKLKGHCGEQAQQGVSLCDKSLHVPETFCRQCQMSSAKCQWDAINMRTFESGRRIQRNLQRRLLSRLPGDDPTPRLTYSVRRPQ